LLCKTLTVLVSARQEHDVLGLNPGSPASTPPPHTHPVRPRPAPSPDTDKGSTTHAHGSGQAAIGRGCVANARPSVLTSLLCGALQRRRARARALHCTLTNLDGARRRFNTSVNPHPSPRWEPPTRRPFRPRSWSRTT